MNDSAQPSKPKPIGLWLTVILSILVTAESAPKLTDQFGYVIGPLVAFAAGTLLAAIGFTLGKLGASKTEP